ANGGTKIAPSTPLQGTGPLPATCDRHDHHLPPLIVHETIAQLVATYGYLVLFLIVGIESFGIPLPGETALVSAAAFAASGRLSIVGVIAAAAVGAIIGDNAGYWLGRKGGLALLHRHGRR